MLSYWERQSFTEYDFVIAGAGITGLSTAIELAEGAPAARILVVERGLLPTGASTRNAGFACMGSATELLADLITMSEAEVVALFDIRCKGLDRLRMRLPDTQTGYAANGSFELLWEAQRHVANQLDYLNNLLRTKDRPQVFRMASDRLPDFGFSGATLMVENVLEGELNTGRMMRALNHLALMKGINIMTGAQVAAFESGGDGVHLQIKDTVRNQLLPLKAHAFCVCTNAFAKDLLRSADVVPGRGQVLITTPIPHLPFKGIFHMDSGYFYFREIDGRVLIGGGRNIDFEGEATTEMCLNTAIQAALEQKLNDVVLHGRPYKVAQRWSGIMAFGATKFPFVGEIAPHVYGAFRMGGMGVAAGSEIAARLAAIVLRGS